MPRASPQPTVVCAVATHTTRAGSASTSHEPAAARAPAAGACHQSSPDGASSASLGARLGAGVGADAVTERVEEGHDEAIVAAPRRWTRRARRGVGQMTTESRLAMISRISAAVSDGVLPTLTPAASRASCLACAVPDEPDTMAPAWPIVLPSGAVKPAT